MDIDLRKEVLDAVATHWADHSTPILLSWLGQGEIGRRAKREAGSLLAFIRGQLAGEVQVLTHTEVDSLVGALPAEVEIEPGSENALLDRTRREATSTEQRFHPAFWAAFLKPLEPHARRLLWRDPVRSATSRTKR